MKLDTGDIIIDDETVIEDVFVHVSIDPGEPRSWDCPGAPPDFVIDEFGKNQSKITLKESELLAQYFESNSDEIWDLIDRHERF